ncbi:hypothetical protein JVT61DRAFT_15441 [Boletus reticuloceps]|uniref:Uncharacterized protein n=1 Tax=Boletus reticuloceps TaxID=495285 RepID=A0A8I2YVF8_9AGAM|nr:hypothetical protein JVT61DRAFT_15441 [Boletus reticuloceps]
MIAYKSSEPGVRISIIVFRAIKYRGHNLNVRRARRSSLNAHGSGHWRMSSVMVMIRRGLEQQLHLFKAAQYSSKHATAAFAASLRSHHNRSFVQARSQSTTTSTSHDQPNAARSWLRRGSSIRVSTIFTALLALGAGATLLGLYEIYTSFTLWPDEVRKDLRAGIRAKNQGDHALSERFLARAYQTALSLPLSVLGSDPYLKLSGIAAVLAEVSPARRAKQVLKSVWEKGDVSTSASSDSAESGNNSSNDWAAYSLTNEERLRRVAVACKLAELCSNEDGEEEEKWLSWAVEEVLRLAGVQTAHRNSAGGKAHANSTSTSVVLAELELPPWMRRVDLGAPLAALGSVYAHKGNVEYAMPLYLQAISLLLPPNAGNVPIKDRCEAAQLMNNLSELIMRRPPSPEIRHQAQAWARQAYGLIERVDKMPLPRRGWFSSSGEQSREVCDQVLGVVLFNLGMLREMDNDHATARSLYKQSLEQCERVGMKEGVLQTKRGLRRIERADG